MPSLNPPFIPKFFHPQKSIQGQYFRNFYLSWEDALWHLLQFSRIPDGAPILIPSFYCGDVAHNMQNHGLTPVYYPLDSHLCVDLTSFQRLIIKHKPRLVVIFHPVGMTSNLLLSHKSWLPLLPKDCLLIEDCVHRLLEPSQIKFITPHHYLIDSLRKVAPLQGSWLYSSHQLPSLSFPQRLRTAPYRFEVHLWWLIMQLGLFTTHRLAHYALTKAYSLIGDHRLGSPGYFVMQLLSNYLNIPRIKSLKTQQVTFYLAHLDDLLQSPLYFKIPIPPSDYRELRDFPLGIHIQYAKSFSQSINLTLPFELDDSPWSKLRKLVYLPLGPHISSQDQTDIIDKLRRVGRTVMR